MASPARLISVVPRRATAPSWVYASLQTAPQKVKRNTAYAQWAKHHDHKGYREYMRLCDQQDQYVAKWQPPNECEIDALWEVFDATWDEYFPKPQQELALLGVDVKATPKEIKRAYRRQAKRLHPDVGGDADAMKQLNAAYRLLTK